MKNHTKLFYEKMIDFKRFAVVLLAVGVFFYLGVIIPSISKSPMNSNILVVASASFMAISMLCFIQSKKYRIKLLELQDGEQYLNKK